MKGLSNYFTFLSLFTSAFMLSLTSCSKEALISYYDVSKAHNNKKFDGTLDSAAMINSRLRNQKAVFRDLFPIPDIECDEENFYFFCDYFFHGEIFQRILSASEILPNAVGSIKILLTLHGKATFQFKKSFLGLRQIRVISDLFEFDYILSINAEISGSISCHGACSQAVMITGREQIQNIHKNFKNKNSNPAFPEIPGIHFSSSIDIPWSLMISSPSGTDVKFRQKYQIDARGHGTPLLFNVPKPEASFRNKFENGRNTFPTAEFQASPHFRALVSHRRSSISVSLSVTTGLRLSTKLEKTNRSAADQSKCDDLESTLRPFVSNATYIMESTTDVGLDENVYIDTVPTDEKYSSISSYPEDC